MNVSRVAPLVFGLAGLVAGRPAAGQDIPGRVRFTFDLPRLTLAPVPDLEPGGRFGLRTLPALVVARRRQALTARLAAAARERWADRVLASVQPPPGDVTVSPGPVVPPPEPDPERFLPLGRLVDLNLELNARVETSVEQLRNLNCAAQEFSNPASGCRTPFPTPVIGEQFQLRAGGVIADRLNLNVDFDTQREFTADNNINLWYQGREDEILRRVEVGNLDFRLPESRFITSGIPANSFGMMADAQIGPIELRSILAQQRGSSVRTRTFTVGNESSVRIERLGRDLEFERGRFFFAVDPRTLPNYPAVDVLALSGSSLPPDRQPVDVRVYRLRAQSGTAVSSPNLGGIDAVAVRPDSPQRVGPFPWELLVEGFDYYLDPSGVWFGLRNRLRDDEYLAVSFVTAAGDTVGTFPSVNGTVDTLHLVHEPRRGFEVPTAFYELRNVYRVDADVTRGSIGLTVRVNDSQQPLDGRGTYLARLGLSRATDPTRVDEYNRVFPRERDPNQGAPLRELFVVFPHLQPLADPLALQPGERADSLYRTPTYLLDTEGPATLFRFEWAYEVSGSGDRSQLSLGALRVRPGSEQITAAGRPLVREVDYTIAYDVGVVTFMDPDLLFAGPTEVQVRFEEQQLFDVAPRNVFGVAGTYNVGRRGRINAIGLFQRERSVFTRPRLGLEPQAMLTGGVSGEFVFRADWLTDLLDGLPLLDTDVPSTLEVSGEVAVSRPNPNREGQAYVEEFETEASRRIRLNESEFQFGSQPASGLGVPAQLLGATGDFEPLDAVPLIWQNAIEANGGPFEIGPQQIDTAIVTTGTSSLTETLLWFTLKPDTVGGAPAPVTGAPRWIRSPTPGPRWRSMTQALDRSGLGVDLSRTEFLEFWLLEDFALTARQQGVHLIFDFGTVREDAIAFGPDTLVVNGPDTTFAGFQLLGVGRLDSEKDPVTNAFNASVHDVGILGDLVSSIFNATTGQVVANVPLCEQGFTVGLPVFPLGSLNAHCTRRNGLIDSEDLNGDNRLDVTVGPASEEVVRHVVPVGDPRFVVRSGVTLPDVAGRPRTWRLYRIPFRQDTVQVGRPDLRRIQAMRITVAAPDLGASQEEVSLAFARMRLLGAPWLKRAPTPLVGLSGVDPAPQGEVVASVISTDNQDLGYTSPPGVRNEADRRGAPLEPGQIEINERSLRLIARDLRMDERAEAFLRFGDVTDRNFLKYRRLRVWARGRGPGWAENDLNFFIKVGRDEFNFYSYQTAARTDDWLPEVVIDLEQWLALRAEIERRWLRGDPPSGAAACGGDPLAYVACDGPYLVQIRDPAVSPPNLARVSEVAVGIYRRAETVVIPETEVWVDDIRLSDVVDDVGVAQAFDARLTAADFLELSLSTTSEDDRFRQLDEATDYRGDRITRVGATVRADKLLPSSWGFNIPVTVERVVARADPFFVQQRDVRADALDGFRTPESEMTLVQVALRRTRRGESLAERMLVDPVSVVASRQTGSDVTELSRGEFRDQRLRLDYNNRPAPVTVAGAPGFLISLVNGLPDWISESEFGEAVRTSRLRLNPRQIRLVSGLTDSRRDLTAFRLPVGGMPADSAARPLRSAEQLWRNELALELRPFPSLGFRVDYTTARDLRDYGDSTAVARLADAARREALGADVGFERERTLETLVSVSPVINSWLRPSFSVASSFGLFRDPNAPEPVRLPSGGFRLPEAVHNRIRREIGSTVDLARMAAAFGLEDDLPGQLVAGVLPADVRFRRTRGSAFDRVVATPDLAYHLGAGGFEEFQTQAGVLANTAFEIEEWTAAGGAQLPLGFLVRLNYREVATNTWIRRADRQVRIDQRTLEWPSGGFTWVYTPRWDLRRLLSTVTAQANYRESGTFMRNPGFGTDGVVSENDRRSVNPSVTITWANGMVTSARVSSIRSDITTAGNLTRSDLLDLGGTMTFSVRAPTWLVRLPSDVRATLGVGALDQAVCVRRAGTATCEPVTDTRRRQVTVRLDTAFPPNMRGGANFSYVLTESRHASTRFGELQFSIFVDINFLANQIR